MFDSCREWGRGWGAEMVGPQTVMPKVPAHTLPTVYMSILTFSLKKKRKNVHFISPYLLQRLFSVTSLWFTLKYVDDT